MLSRSLRAFALALTIVCVDAALPAAQTQTVTIVIVRHGETAGAVPPAQSPLSAVGRQRVALLVDTLRGVRFTDIFATHTLRARQAVEPVAAAQKLPIVQLPVPGSILNGLLVSDQTSRQAAIEPIANALLKLPAGSVALVGGNSDNIYGILNKLGVPVAAPGQTCPIGSMCVPCVTNECYPGTEYDRLWYLVIEANRAKPLTMIETRYGVGWSPAKN
jgi:hypothetical protein